MRSFMLIWTIIMGINAVYNYAIGDMTDAIIFVTFTMGNCILIKLDEIKEELR